MILKNKKKKLNSLLMKVIAISVGMHVIAGLIAGVITVAKIVMPEDAQFEEPPAVVEDEPPPSVKVQIKPQQPKQQQAQHVGMRPVANIAVANVDVNLPDIEQNFTVSAGLGSMSGGSLLGGTRGSIGMGRSNVSVFGLKTKAERILFVIDANRRMVTDQKGGLNSYKVIKDEITDMVGNLSAGTLFNVMLKDESRTMLFKPKLSSAGSKAHQQLIQWLTPINSDATNVGLEQNPSAKTPKLSALADEEMHQILPIVPWNITAFMTQHVLEQNVDTIFFITGHHSGFAGLRRGPNQREKADYDRAVAKPDYQKQLAKFHAEIPKMRARISAELAKINAQRKAKGLPPRVLAHQSSVTSNAHELGLAWENYRPPSPPTTFAVDDRLVREYFGKLVDELYENHDKPVPSVNVVLFLAGDEVFDKGAEQRLDQYVKFFQGRKRVIRGEDEIKSARSSKDTKN